MIRLAAEFLLATLVGYILGRMDARDRAENLRHIRTKRASVQRAARIARRHRCGLVWQDDSALQELQPFQISRGGDA